MDREILAEIASRLASEIPNALPQIENHLANETFHDMCLEYEDCMKSLKHWQQLPDQERIDECGELMDDLLAEILQFLAEHPQ